MMAMLQLIKNDSGLPKAEEMLQCSERLFPALTRHLQAVLHWR